MSEIDNIIVIAEYMIERFGDRAPQLALEWALNHFRDDEAESGAMWQWVHVTTRELLRLRKTH